MPRSSARLEELALSVVRETGALRNMIHPVTQRSLAELLCNMNSYYSNLIEGHHTHPKDIERALNNNLSKNKAQRLLQLESKAHVEVQLLMEKRLIDEPQMNICSSSFIQWIHLEFYKRLPTECLQISDVASKSHFTMKPGELREKDVVVGHHTPPRWESLSAFMERFASIYNPHRLSGLQRIIAVGASHHRLAWIHPFLDGNGRVCRLFTHAYLTICQLDGHGMWTMARGLSRTREKYMAALDAADNPRQGDLDGRGNLTDRGLHEFCEYFLETALDQIAFMQSLLNLENIESAFRFFIAERKLKTETLHLFRDLLYRGELSRGDAGDLLGLKPAQARIYLNRLLEIGVLRSDSPKGKVRIAFPTFASEIFFPRLFPSA